jgi:type III pantothenate kinase
MELDLLLDIGNTRSKWITTQTNTLDSLAIFQEGIINNVELVEQILEQFKPTFLSNQPQVINNIYCTCVGQPELLKIWQDYFPSANFYRLSGDTTIPEFNNQYQHPLELGSDRLAGMFGAKSLYPNRNILVVASGTATTIDYLHASSIFRGGWIIPGLDLMLKSLGKSTANLPTLEANQFLKESSNDPSVNDPLTPEVSFGKSTKDAIGMGVILSTIGAIQLALSQINEIEIILLTGGNAPLLRSYLLPILKGYEIKTEPNLILVGINSWRLNKMESCL